MAKGQNINNDLETFIEYQQVLKESDIVNTQSAKKQVFDIYKGMMSTKEGKEIITKHNSFKTSLIKLKGEEAWLKDNLHPLISNTSKNVSITRHQPIGATDIIKSEVEDMAKSLTSNRLHPFLKEHPEKQKHALGVLARVAGNRLEQNQNLTQKLEFLTEKFENMVGNLMSQGTDQNAIKSLMDVKPQVQEVASVKSFGKSQGLEI